MRIDLWKEHELDDFHQPWPHPNRGLYVQYSPKIRILATADNSQEALLCARVTAVVMALSLGYVTADGKNFYYDETLEED
jgi:hypothetical protein